MWVTVFMFVWMKDKKKMRSPCSSNRPNNFSNKLQQKAPSERPATVFENTTWRSANYCFCTKSNLTHAVRTLRRLFKSEKGVNRFRNMSGREGGAGEEINKSESQSFTLVSTLASVNAWVYYLPRSLSFFPPKQETSRTALPGGADSSNESLGCCWRSIKTRMWSICHHTKTCNDKNALPREDWIFVSANHLFYIPWILTNEAPQCQELQQFYNF